jgi:hypothetical protein
MSITHSDISLTSGGNRVPIRSGVLESPEGLLDTIEHTLSDGNGQRAARMLIDAVNGRLLLAGLSLEQWLRELNEPARAKLVAAFAHYPCFACLNGAEPCDSCGGNGFAAVEQVCAPCAGFGSKRCDFCNGSGLATYSVVPVQLRLQVLVARAKRAGKYLEKVTSQPMERGAETAIIRQIQDINKLLGVLENAALSARQLAESERIGPEFAARLATTCDRWASAGLDRMRQMIGELSRIHRSRASALQPVDAENAEAQAEFYENLAQSVAAFEGTGLSHPFLSTAT